MYSTLRSQKAVFLALLFIAVAFWLLNRMTWLYADDYSYAFAFGPNGGIDLQAPVSLDNLLGSQYNHYLSKNGRSIAHGLAHLFLCFHHKWLFDICNTLVFAAFMYMLQVVSKKRDWRFTLLTATLLILLARSFGQVFLWQLGALNYLWAGFFNLLLLWAFWHHRRHCRWHVAMLLALSAVLVGWINEAVSVGVLTMLAATTIGDWLKSRRLPWVPLLITLAYLCGTLLIILSPGTMRRAAAAGIDTHYMLTHLGFGTLNILANLRFFWLTATVAVVLLAHRKATLAGFCSQEGKWLLAILAQTLFLIPLGHVVEPRALFGIEMFSLIILLHLLPLPSKAWSAPVVLASIAVYMPVWHVVQENHCDTLAFHNEMSRYDEVVFFDNPTYAGLKRHYVGSRVDLDHHRTAFNKEFATYHHKKGLLVLPARFRQELYHTSHFLTTADATPDGGYTADDITFIVYPIPHRQPLPPSTIDHEYVSFPSGCYLLKDKFPFVHDGNVQKRAIVRKRK